MTVCTRITPTSWWLSRSTRRWSGSTALIWSGRRPGWRNWNSGRGTNGSGPRKTPGLPPAINSRKKPRWRRPWPTHWLSGWRLTQKTASALRSVTGMSIIPCFGCWRQRERRCPYEWRHRKIYPAVRRGQRFRWKRKDRIQQRHEPEKLAGCRYQPYPGIGGFPCSRVLWWRMERQKLRASRLSSNDRPGAGGENPMYRGEGFIPVWPWLSYSRQLHFQRIPLPGSAVYRRQWWLWQHPASRYWQPGNLL